MLLMPLHVSRCLEMRVLSRGLALGAQPQRCALLVALQAHLSLVPHLKHMQRSPG